MEFAEVVLNLPVRRAFPYEIPSALRGHVVPGARVTVPFGRRTEEGTCVRLLRSAASVGEIGALVETVPAVPDALMELARWMSERYLCSWGQALAVAAPPGIHKRARAPRPVKYARLVVDGDDPVRAAIRDAGGIRRCAGLDRAALRRLEREGAVAIESIEPDVEIPEARLFREEEPASLTPDQSAALEAILPSLGTHRVFLLDGVTASGKTEVYIRAIRAVHARGGQAIVLMPEISLTAQMIGRLQSRLGRAALMHSRVGASARARQWRAAAAGDAPLVLGARSAVFTPMPRLGLIVVDEEHDGSYKDPVYHARDAAIERARRAGVPVILGSATPSIESMYRARRGDYARLRMPTRIGGRAMPAVEVVDRRESGLISPRLRAAAERELAAGRQIILYLNRRGYATSVRCRRCQSLLRCGRCEIVQAYHRSTRGMLCHYCLQQTPLPSKCPECGQAALKQFGAGTERIEEELARMFPDVGIVRMDTDSTHTRAAFREALRRFGGGEARILVGTKMIAKGLHFPNVTLVGVVSADTAFHLPDFRAAEKTFQDLTHVTGRPGRGEHPGRVVIQTYHAGHYSVRCAATHDYEGFYKQELENRRALGYPPFSELVRLLFEGTDAAGVQRLSRKFCGDLRRVAGLEVLGPQPAPRVKLRGRHRIHALVKSTDGAAMRAAIAERLDRVPMRGGVQLTVDVDPYEVL